MKHCIPTPSRRNALLTAVFALSSAVAIAAPINFDFEDPKKVNSISFVLDSQLEPIMGLADGITGVVTYDPRDPATMTGKISVAANSLHILNERMTSVLHSSDWLDVETHKSVDFVIRKVAAVKPYAKDVFELMVEGDFTLKGVTKPIKVPVRVSYLEGRLPDRQKGKQGDLLVFRSSFPIKRAEYGIKPDSPGDKVAPIINIQLAIVGFAGK